MTSNDLLSTFVNKTVLFWSHSTSAMLGFFHEMRQNKSGKDRPGSYAGHIEGASGGVKKRTR